MLLEANDAVGGCCSTTDVGGYTAPAGGSVIELFLAVDQTLPGRRME
jgi:phytoene dehydrogenase-like protein